MDLLWDAATQEDITNNDDLEKICGISKEINKSFRETDEAEGAGVNEMPRDAATQESATVDNGEDKVPDEPPKEPAIKETVVGIGYKTMAEDPEEPHKETAASKGANADEDHDLQKILVSAAGIYEKRLEIHEMAKGITEASLKIHGLARGTRRTGLRKSGKSDGKGPEEKPRGTAGQGDALVNVAASPDPRALTEKTGLEDIPMNIPCKKIQHPKKKTKSNKGL